MIKKTSMICIVWISTIILAACGSAQTATPATSTSTPGFTQTVSAETPSATAASESTATSTSQAESPTADAMQTPTPMGSKVEGQTQWDAMALQVAQAVGFTTSDVEIYQLPANTSWDATLSYYTAQAAASGWGDAPTQTNDMAGGHAAVWSVTADGTTRYFVIAQVDSVDGSYTLNLLGQ